MKEKIPVANGNGRSILVINPNTNPAVTERISIVADKIVSPGTEIHTVNPENGPFGIETSEERAEAEQHVLSIIRHGIDKGFCAFVLACFDDIGLVEARGLANGPVVGSCEAGIGISRTIANRFSIVTTYNSAIPTINLLMKRYGILDIARVQAAGISVAEAATNSEDNQDLAVALHKAIEIDKAESILLGSGGLTGRADSISKQFGIPVVDGTAAAIKFAESALALISDSLTQR